MAYVDYAAYLQSPTWRARADAVKRSAGFRCQTCNAPGPLDVHHRTYERIGNESPSDLIALCRSCHSLFEREAKIAPVWMHRLIALCSEYERDLIRSMRVMGESTVRMAEESGDYYFCAQMVRSMELHRRNRMFWQHVMVKRRDLWALFAPYAREFYEALVVGATVEADDRRERFKARLEQERVSEVENMVNSIAIELRQRRFDVPAGALTH